MNLLNQKVIHKTFGIGAVVTQDERYISVAFATKTSKFPYPAPDTFVKFLQAETPAVQEALLQELADAKAAEDAAKHAIEEAQRLAEAEAEAQRKAEAAARVQARALASPKKAVPAQVRIPGQPMVFFVFQGSTYDRESRGGYIWAPISNKSGNTFHHWTRLLDVRPGDILLHSCNGYLQAVSTAQGECYDYTQPPELRVENQWDLTGRRVDCDYITIKRPVKTANFISDILRLCNVKYAPFNKSGNGNVGYLYEIDRELARIFLNAAVKQNDELNDVAYIRALLEESTVS